MQEPQNAIALARISYDRLRDKHGVDDQEADLLPFGEQLGWNIRWVIKENHVSAYKRTRREPNGDGGFTMRTNRPELRKVLRMLRTARLTAYSSAT